jgi:hypothetical protein
MSQLSLRQVTTADVVEQLPSSWGTCPVTVGMGPPLTTFGAQVRNGVLQYSVGKQSPSTRQPLATPQTFAFEHTPLRHTTMAVVAEQVPSPSAYPHRLSAMSHTRLSQTMP